MAKYEQLEATRKAAATLVDSLNKAKEFPEIHSAVVAFITTMDGTTDGGTRVLGDGDFAALFLDSLVRRKKSAETHAIALLNSARAMKAHLEEQEAIKKLPDGSPASPEAAAVQKMTKRAGK